MSKKYLNCKTIMQRKGVYPYGKYVSAGLLKIARQDKLPNGRKKHILFKNYYAEDTVNLVKEKNIAKYIIVFYELLSPEENKTLIKNYCRLLSNDYKAKFCSYHSKELYRVLKDEFNSFMLDMIFQIGYVPDQFELVFNGNKTIVKPFEYKTQWENNRNQFEVFVCE